MRVLSRQPLFGVMGKSRNSIAAIVFLFAFVVSPVLEAVEPAGISHADAIRLREVFRLSRAAGNRFWDGWDDAPYAILLVTADVEYLIGHPNPFGDFQLLNRDGILGESVYFRKRQYPTDFLATFPAIDAVPTIVVGQAEQTAAASSTRWVLIVLHEHFHQLQMSRPDYFEKVDALDLSGGDTTGMWMLNYPFPYESAQMNEHFSDLTRMLHGMLSMKADLLPARWAEYSDKRKAWKELLSPKDYLYFSFQIWQEGISRYTEWKLAEWAAEHYEPSDEFKQLADFTSFQEAAETIRREVEEQLMERSLMDGKRVTLYPFGAAEGILLDRVNPEWRRNYFSGELNLENLFPAQSE